MSKWVRSSSWLFKIESIATVQTEPWILHKIGGAGPPTYQKHDKAIFYFSENTSGTRVDFSAPAWLRCPALTPLGT